METNNNQDRQKKVNIITVLIILVGFCSAVILYLTAREPEENPLADQLENSKIFNRSLELYGGKANLLATEFSRWFGTLWHGKSLAFTVMVISAVIAALFYFIASPLPPEEK
jgi:ABC-type phosphate/phosphonate transport system permease subunit